MAAPPSVGVPDDFFYEPNEPNVPTSPAAQAAQHERIQVRRPKLHTLPQRNQRSRIDMGQAATSSASSANLMRAAERAGAQLEEEFKSLFVSEWLTQHPLNLTYPQHIWLHADCPGGGGDGGGAAAEVAFARGAEAGLRSGAEATRQHVDYLNRVGIVKLQDGKLDDALVAFKEMEQAVKAEVAVQRERGALLAVVYNNLAGFYYRRSKPQSALQYIQRAAGLERRVHGAVDFATLARLGAVCSKLKAHTEGLAHCRAALETLERAGSQNGDATLPREYHACLAVVYHNLAVQLAHAKQLQQASAMANVAETLAARALPSKHRWAKQIAATVHRVRDLHVSLSFVEHSLRPRLAAHQAQQQSRQASRASLSRDLWTQQQQPESDAKRSSNSMPAGFSILDMFSDEEALKPLPVVKGGLSTSTSLPVLKGAQ
jgi:tetratricopeptide (TPR) repeat protein